MEILAFILQLLRSGLGNLASYLAAHVLLCLLTALIPKETITHFLGRKTPGFISYPAAALAGSVLAVCSCTIVPLFAGIYKKGAGLGPAITFLFFAPAGNILAIAYTGVAIGADIALARIILSLSFGIGIGLIMALIFRKSDEKHDKLTDESFAGQAKMRRSITVFLLVLVALLLAGTLKIDLLTNTYTILQIPLPDAQTIQNTLTQLVPFDASRGEEGVSIQGAVLILLLGFITITAWKGLDKIHDGFTFWTWLSLGLLAFTLLFASLGVVPQAAGLDMHITGKFIGVAVLMAASGWIMFKYLTRDELRDWLWESWRFVKQIFPLLIVGVFVVGIIRVLIQPEWIEALAGRNTVLGNMAGVLFGVFMYFPTLVEVPIANMFLGLGMHRGPLLAYLMADPELSLQSILIVSTIIGKLKSWTYVGWVALFSTTSGLLYGLWVDGTSAGIILLLLAGFLALLSAFLWLASRWSLKQSTVEKV
jgi:uncharacterized membrane protein YraQ (UPF0718 family)